MSSVALAATPKSGLSAVVGACRSESSQPRCCCPKQSSVNCWQRPKNNIKRKVDNILVAKQRDAEADVSAVEREIDQLVYALYGLTPEEIQIVEGAAK